MKKILALIFLLLAQTAYAGTISFDQLATSSDLTVSKWNADMNRVYQKVNTDIATDNIADDTLLEADMADEINPRIRTYEGASCEKVEGLLPLTTVGTLTGNIASGTAYPRGYRISKTSATSKTWTASKWTFTDIDINGNFQYSEVAIDAATPAVATNSIRLARVSTDGTQVLDVQDLRTTSCASGPFSNIADATGEATLSDILKNGRAHSVSNDIGWVQGVQVSWDGVSSFKVKRGSIYINGEYRAVSTDITVPQTADAPSSGTSGLDTGAIASSTRYNVFAVADQEAVKTFSVSISTGNAPTGVTNYRKIGEIYTDSTSFFSSRDMVTTSQIDEKQLISGLAHFNGSTPPGVYQGYNVSGVTRLAAGRYRVDWFNQFISGDQYTVVCNSGGNTGNINSVCMVDPQTSENTRASSWVRVTNSAGSEGDNNALHVYVIAAGKRNNQQ